MPRAHRRYQRGVAAMEFILALPVLLALLIGLYNIASMTAAITTLNTAANFTAELISRNDTTVDVSLVDDYITGATKILLGSYQGVAIDVYGYGASSSSSGQIKWRRKSPGQTVRCSAASDNVPISPDSTDAVGKLLSNGSDVILVKVCADFSWPITKYFAVPNVTTKMRLERQMVVGPRQSPGLTCTGC